MVYMSHLEQLSEYMVANDRYSVSFTVRYNSHPFNCLYINNLEEPILYISSLGENSFTIKLIGDSEFHFSSFLGDKYSLLIRYLSLTFQTGSPFSPTAFFEAFNNLLPVECDHRPRPADIAQIVNMDEKPAERDKIYFCGWSCHGNTVSDLNFRKSCALIPYEDAVILRKAHVSSKWSAEPREERLERIARYQDFE